MSSMASLILGCIASVVAVLMASAGGSVAGGLMTDLASYPIVAPPIFSNLLPDLGRVPSPTPADHDRSALDLPVAG
jgi:hypothetical protein